jgi:alkylation response protein AidB-like acyl-CoA dehydrogenase
MKPDTLEKPETAGQPVVDTRGMSEGKQAALELTESARESIWHYPTFAGRLFMGELKWSMIHPYPFQSDDDRKKGDVFLTRLEAFLREYVDPDEIDRTGEIPDEVIAGLAKLGAFGIKIPEKYGGLGLSQVNYNRTAMLLGTFCGNITALISAHQSIGVPQPLLMFGTEEQKQKYLPRIARGEISAFALTEEKVGSDPARMETVAAPSNDGETFVLNGKKLWCTNGTRAGVIVVMARTPSKTANGKEKKQITAFIVETSWPGVHVERRCHFMGLHALYNAVISFKDVKVPRANIISGEGHGLRVALTTLNTGRLTLPAACAGLSRRCLEISLEWSREREQWGAPIGHHAAIADKLAHMAANQFAMESMALLSSALSDSKSADIRLEAAMAKMWCSEAAWNIVNDTMQIRGGRGYETAASLLARGEKPVPVERWLRDCRINLIFEGSSEIMRLFIAREALDPHLRIGGAVLMPGTSVRKRLIAAGRAMAFYLRWYPGLLIPSTLHLTGMNKKLAGHVRRCERISRRLARVMLHAMAVNGPKLEREQILLGHFVDIGTELFAMTATCSRAQAVIERKEQADHTVKIADYFCRESQLRIRRSLDSIRHHNRRMGYKLARMLLDQNH